MESVLRWGRGNFFPGLSPSLFPFPPPPKKNHSCIIHVLKNLSLSLSPLSLPPPPPVDFHDLNQSLGFAEFILLQNQGGKGEEKGGHICNGGIFRQFRWLAKDGEKKSKCVFEKRRLVHLLLLHTTWSKSLINLWSKNNIGWTFPPKHLISLSHTYTPTFPVRSRRPDRTFTLISSVLYTHLTYFKHSNLFNTLQ